jgi:hypothetical protein
MNGWGEKEKIWVGHRRPDGMGLLIIIIIIGQKRGGGWCVCARSGSCVPPSLCVGVGLSCCFFVLFWFFFIVILFIHLFIIIVFFFFLRRGRGREKTCSLHVSGRTANGTATESNRHYFLSERERKRRKKKFSCMGRRERDSRRAYRSTVFVRVCVCVCVNTRSRGARNRFARFPRSARAGRTNPDAPFRGQSERASPVAFLYAYPRVCLCDHVLARSRVFLPRVGPLARMNGWMNE